MTSNPCYNGGTCLPRDNGQSKRRFACKCPDAYTGNRCQKPIRSCRGYSNGNRVAGKYKILDGDKTLHEVFCDFDTNSSMTWTLIESFQRDQIMESLSFDEPLNQDNHTWNGYRLSKTRMESIQNDSLMWRATCQYQEHSNCSDLVRGFNDKINILTQKDGCFEVEYINVAGYFCSNCTVFFYQKPSWTFHFYFREKREKENKCYFQPNVSVAQADYFGAYYSDWIDTGHCCSKSPTTTTQVWFGGQ